MDSFAFRFNGIVEADEIGRFPLTPRLFFTFRRGASGIYRLLPGLGRRKGGERDGKGEGEER